MSRQNSKHLFETYVQMNLMSRKEFTKLSIEKNSYRHLTYCYLTLLLKLLMISRNQ